MKYRISKDECESRIAGVCSQCGGELSAIETVDNGNNPTYWAGCKRCMRFDGGVDPLVYDVAKALVEDDGYRHYSHIHIDPNDTEEMRKYKIESQISGACGIVAQIRSMLAGRTKE